ncbi:uncharacterized protein LOC143297736 isoform X2 [Babylonia areolata]|uniref:uncharacterized protein LOC143297736 isoform X2 n=1 Tax=Babylonia areolata TaxID=304850 RepID=UPI003FD57A6A
MLQQLQLVADSGTGDTSLPSIPLVNHLAGSSDQYVHVDHSRGLREFLFIQDVLKLERFQTQYADNATPIREARSRMEKQGEVEKSQHLPEVSFSDEQATLTEESAEPISETGSRQIPQWMLRNRGSSMESDSAQVSLEKSSSNSSTEGRGRSRHTVYIMTEKELMETARDVLRQAGRQDLIETCTVHSAEVQMTHSARNDGRDKDTLKKEKGDRDIAQTSSVLKDMEMTEIIEPTPAACDSGQKAASNTSKDADMTKATCSSFPLETVEECAATASKKQRQMQPESGTQRTGHCNSQKKKKAFSSTWRRG